MNYAIILAGGNGSRFGKRSIPKQFVELTGMPMVAYSMKTAQKNPSIDSVCVVAAPAYSKQVAAWSEQYGISKLKYFAEAGKERYDSVFSGICTIPAQKSDIIMVMTSVCPFLSQATINKHMEKIAEYDGLITVVKATDAITFSNDGRRANRTLQKKKLFIQQGPQTYRYGILKEAHEFYRSDSDRFEVYEDSELALNLGIDVGMILGDRFCIKVTYPEDLAIAQALYPLFTASEEKYSSGVIV